MTSDVRPDQLGQHGFHPGLTFEEARDKASILNKDSELKRLAARKVRVAKRMEAESLALATAFPDEQEFLAWAQDNYGLGGRAGDKFSSHWHCGKKLVVELAIKPSEFGDRTRSVYNWFKAKQLAPAYLEKILRVLNLYGKFHAQRYRVFVAEIAMPTGYVLADLEDAYLDRKPNGGASKPLDPGALERAKGSLTEENYRWLYLAIWAGLRPAEVDLLLKEGQYKLAVEDGVTVLHVFQQKLRKLPRAKRWKLIPLIEPEQAAIPEIIEGASFKRPLVKTMVRYFGDGSSTYSPRKGFEKLMRDRGHDFFHVSAWLGHQSVDQTWRAYTQQQAPRWRKPGAA
jgi:hypothetical protein